MLSLRAISRPQGGAHGQADGTHRGSGMGRTWGHSLQPRPGRRRLCRHRAPNEPPRARPGPSPNTGGSRVALTGLQLRHPALQFLVLGKGGVGGTGSASPTVSHRV